MTLATVITKHNYAVCHEIIDFYSPKITEYKFHSVQPTPVMQLDVALIASKENRYFAYNKIRERAKKYNNPKVQISLPDDYRGTDELIQGDVKQISDCPGCNAAYTLINITPDLKLAPCDLSRRNLGDLNNNDFFDLWNSNLLKAIRRPQKVPCSINFKNLKMKEDGTFMKLRVIKP